MIIVFNSIFTNNTLFLFLELELVGACWLPVLTKETLENTQTSKVFRRENTKLYSFSLTSCNLPGLLTSRERCERTFFFFIADIIGINLCHGYSTKNINYFSKNNTTSVSADGIIKIKHFKTCCYWNIVNLRVVTVTLLHTDITSHRWLVHYNGWPILL